MEPQSSREAREEELQKAEVNCWKPVEDRGKKACRLLECAVQENDSPRVTVSKVSNFMTINGESHCERVRKKRERHQQQ